MRRLSLALLIAIGAALPALAHPHVWIDAVVTFVFKDGRIVAIRQDWTFDEMFGDAIVGQFDTNKDKKFDTKELAALEQGAFANLREFDYFSHLSVDDKAVPTKAVQGFAARVEKGRLVYSFTLPVEPGIDPSKGRVALGLYDPSYFVDVQTGGRAGVKYEGVGTMDCRSDLAENTRKPIFGGQVFPMEIFLTCRAP